MATSLTAVETSYGPGGPGAAGRWRTGTFEEMMGADAAEGDLWFVTTIDYQGGVVYPINAFWHRDATKWHNCGDQTIWGWAGTTGAPSITNTTAGTNVFYPFVTLIPPVGLFHDGSILDGVLRTRTTVNGAPTHMPLIRANGATLVTSNTGIDQQYHGRPSAFADGADRLGSGGGGNGMDTTSGTNPDITMAATFNGSSVSLQPGAVMSAAGGDTTVILTMCALTLKRGR